MASFDEPASFEQNPTKERCPFSLSYIKPRNTIVILNLTTNIIDDTLKNEGVFEPTNKDEITKLLTFKDLPTLEEIKSRAERLSTIAEEEMTSKLFESGELTEGDYNEFGLPADCEILIGGQGFLMTNLESELFSRGLRPIYQLTVTETIKEKRGKRMYKKKVEVHKGLIKL